MNASLWIRDLLGDAWSVTGQMSEEVAAYASRLWVRDARTGLMSLSTVLFLLFVAEIGVQAHFGLDHSHLYTFGLLSMLALHVLVSAGAVQDTKSIYVLGTVLLVVSGTAIMLLAHQAGAFTFTLFASIALLFVVVPILPWGLREASVVTLLIYLTFTASAFTGASRFNPQILWALQFIMIGAGVISLVMVARNTLIRKTDVRVRFELEKAHNKLLELSHLDPLTQTYNRRFLTDKFNEHLDLWRAQRLVCHFAYIDVDNFKPINDSFGHDFGDRVLRALSAGFNAVFKNRGFLVRMGGDEFALMFHGSDPEALIGEGKRLMQHSIPNRKCDVDLSVGLVTIPPDSSFTMEQVLRLADNVLYEAKDRKEVYSGQLNLVTCRMVHREAAVDEARAEETAT
jgi:diguanylate cyclase (GGDEF)-like protein